MQDIMQYGKELKEKIKQYDHAYYVLNKPLISDAEYDRIYREYEILEKQYPELKTPDSPTQRVGSEPLSKLEKFTHITPLLSIDQKGKTIAALTKFYNDCGGDGTEVIIQPKFDGLTINNNYANGLLVNAATRGSGQVGELVTESVKTIKSVPLSIDFEGRLEVRGEAIINYNHFLKNFVDEYSNPRNLAAGTMRQLDPKLTAQRKPDIIYYDIGVCDKTFDTDIERLEFLKQLGFKVSPYKVVNNLKDLIDTCFSYFDGKIKIKDGFNVLDMEGAVTDIVCDGLVIKTNNLKLRDELGMTAKGPKWAFAFKFKSLTAKTILRDVVFQVGRTGKITPVAVFDKVNIGGTSVTRATLNNIDYIRNLGPTPPDVDEFEINTVEGTAYFNLENNRYPIAKIFKYQFMNEKQTVQEMYFVQTDEKKVIPFPARSDLKSLFDKKFGNIEYVEVEKDISEYYLKIGQNITIERSNDVIPRLIGINYLESKSNKNELIDIVMPTTCPTCRGEIEEQYPQHFCQNIDCPDRLKGSILHFAQRDALDITGLGESIIDLLVDMGYIKSITDIYKLAQYKNELIKIDNFGEKKVQKLLDAIEETKNREFWRVLYALGIREVGKSMSKELAKTFKNINALINATEEDLYKVADVGETTVHEVTSFFKNEKNLKIIEFLRNEGLKFEDDTKIDSNCLAGMTFIITGTLINGDTHVKKDEVYSVIEKNGGAVVSSVSKKTSVVIVGIDAGSKETKARELKKKGEQIIILEGYDEWIKFFNEKAGS